MKNLKKFFAVLVVVTLMVSSIIMPAVAADSYSYGDQAKKLNELGLYKGVSTVEFNPDLGATLNRETGVVMLLRVVGLEKDALAMPAADVTAALAKFKDAKTISSWAKNQVAYAVSKGLVVGTTATTFAPKASLNGKAYCTLILRQLGYKVEAGASYDAAPTTLSEKGGLTAAEATKFTGKTALIKDDLVGISFGALSAKDSEGKVLFVKLIDAKVITAETAAKAGLETAKIASITAENGKATVVFDKAPVIDPVSADFTVSQAIYGSDATTVTASVYYTAADKTAKLEMTPVAAAAAEQKVTYTVKYKNADAVTKEFTVGALATYDVKSVAAIANTKVEVVLNAEISATNKADFSIKDAAGAAFEVKDAILSSDKKSVVITTAAQTVNTLYTLTLKGKDYKFVGIAAETDKPKLDAAAATKNTKVKVTFNERVDQTSAFNVANYTIAGLSVLSAEFEKDADGNAIKTNVILLTSAQTVGTIYKVVVANVTDVAGNIIDADNDEKEFGGVPADTTKPELDSAAATTNTKVVLSFVDEGELDKTIAENVANYTIAGLTVLKAERTAEKEVTLTTSAQTVGTIYKVVVVNVTDDSKNVINSDKDEKEFGGVPPDTTKPKLSVAAAKNNTSVVLTFEENDAMDEASSETIANYTIAGLTVTKAELNTTAKDATKNKVVTLTTSAQTAGTIYKVAVANVKDASNNVIDADNDEFSFGGLAADTSKPKVTSAQGNGATSVKVVFDKVMDDTSAVQTWCYYLGSELGYPTKVVKDTVVTDGKVWVLTTKEQASKVYTVDVTGATDVSGNVVDEDNDTATFAGVGVPDTAAPKVKAAIALNNNTVKLTFDEAIDNATIAVTDFDFTVQSGTEATPADGKTKLAAADANAFLLSDDKKSVTLQFTNAVMTGGVVYKVTVPAGAVADVAANTIAGTDNTSTFSGLSAANPAPKISSAIAMNSQTLKITFSEPVKVAGDMVAADFTITPGSGAPAFDGDFVKAVLSKDKTYVTVYYAGTADSDKFASGKIYTVTIPDNNQFTDELGLVELSYTNDENKKSFSGISTSVSSPKMSSVIAVDKSTLDITFDQKVNSTLAAGTDADLEIFNGSTEVTAADTALIRTEGEDGNKIRVFLVAANTLEAGKVYKVVLAQAKIANENGVQMVADDNDAQFAAVGTENAAPKIVGVAKVNDTTLKVTFSEVIANVAANGSDFTIEGGTVSAAALVTTGDDANKQVTLTVAGLTANTVYTLKIATTTITDEAGVGAVDKTVDMKFAY